MSKHTALGFLLAALAVLAVLTACTLTNPATTPPPTIIAATPIAAAGTPVPATDLLHSAISATLALQRYHYTYRQTYAQPGHDMNLEGDYLFPDQGYVKGTLAGHEIEHLFSYSMILARDGAHWVRLEAMELPPDEMLLIFSPSNMSVQTIHATDPLLSYIPAITDVLDVGLEETASGVQLRRLTFNIDPAKLGPGKSSNPFSGMGAVWIEPATHYIYMYTLTETSTMPQLSADGTAAPGAPLVDTSSSNEVTLSRHNDPSIALPPVDLAGVMAQPSPTHSADDPTLVQQAFARLDSLQSVHYTQVITAASKTQSSEGDYIPVHPDDWRHEHASTQQIEYELQPLSLGVDFQMSGATEPINGVATQAFNFNIPWYGGGSDGRYIVPPEARSGKIPFIGTGTVYIAPTTGDVHKLVITTTIEGTMISTLTLSHHNDPAIGDAAATQQELPPLLDAMDALNSYHFLFLAATDSSTETLTIEGDHNSPGNDYYKVTSNIDGVLEYLVRGDDFYFKGAGGWEKQDGKTLGALPGGVLLHDRDLSTDVDVINWFRQQLRSTVNIKKGNGTPINGIATRAYTFSLAADDKQEIGHGTIYVDLTTPFIHQLQLDQFVSSLEDNYYLPNGHTATPQPETQIHITLTYSRPNDPTITLPAP